MLCSAEWSSLEMYDFLYKNFFFHSQLRLQLYKKSTEIGVSPYKIYSKQKSLKLEKISMQTSKTMSKGQEKRLSSKAPAIEG